MTSNDTLSNCHLAPLVFDEQHPEEMGPTPCSYCGKLATAVPYYHEPAPSLIELAMRRFKDGDQGYDEALQTIKEAYDRARWDSLRAAQRGLQPDLPKWTLNVQTGVWEELEALAWPTHLFGPASRGVVHCEYCGVRESPDTTGTACHERIGSSEARDRLRQLDNQTKEEPNDRQ